LRRFETASAGAPRRFLLLPTAAPPTLRESRFVSASGDMPICFFLARQTELLSFPQVVRRA